MAFPVSDYLETLGGAVNESGLATRRFQSPLVTGIAAGLGGFATATAAKEAKRFKKAKADFEKQIGMNYDLFVKLGSAAQKEILTHSGYLPGESPLPQFGGRTPSELETLGAPGRTEMAQGTGAFAGEPAREVQLGPDLPPLSLYKGAPSARVGAIDRYLGNEPTLTPYQEGQLADRRARTEIYRGSAADRAKESRDRRLTMTEQRAALRALRMQREDVTAPVEPWEADVARTMGVPLPEGVLPTRKELDQLMRYNRPVGAVVSAIDKLSTLAREAEITKGRKLTDAEIQAVVTREGASLAAIAGPSALSTTLTGVKARLEALRQLPDIFNTPALPAEEEPPPDEGDDTGENDQNYDENYPR